MTLGQKQELFGRLLGKLLIRASGRKRYGCPVGEVFRPPEMCRIYYERGAGILHSNHGRKLAVDLYLSYDGKVVWDAAHYRWLGDYWHGLDPLCRWGALIKDGGDFRSRNDPYHFSLQHGKYI